MDFVWVFVSALVPQGYLIRGIVEPSNSAQRASGLGTFLVAGDIASNVIDIKQNLTTRLFVFPSQ